MLLSPKKTELTQEKMSLKNSFIGTTVPASGEAHVWKDQGLEYCNYVLYENGLLTCNCRGQHFTSEPMPNTTRYIYFTGKSNFLLFKNDESGIFFSKDAPIAEDFSCLLLFKMGKKIVLIVADNLFSNYPKRFEFDISKRNLNLCHAILFGLIAQRNIADANRLKPWFVTIKKPLKLK